MQEVPTATDVPVASRGPLARILWLILLAGGAYFVVRRALPYLVISADSYGPYFWPRVGVVLPHVVFGILALALGAIQFSGRIRTRYAAVHRSCGWAYLVCVLGGAVAALALAVTSMVSLVYATGLGTLAVFWIAASSMGLVAIRRRNLAQHRHWMIRSYVLTFAFPAFRLIEEGLGALAIGTRTEQLMLAAWACWTIPLCVTEILLQSRATFRARVPARP